MFDTLRFARAPCDGGQFTPEESERLSEALSSEALSDAIAGEMPARADLEATGSRLGRKIDDLRGEFGAVEAKLDHEIKSLEARIDRGLKEVRADLRTEIKGVEAEIRGIEAKIEAAIVLARILGH